MSRAWGRRAFLRRTGLACIAAPALPLAGCVPDRPSRLDSSDWSVTRPVLLPWSVDAVRISAPPPELPVTYVSIGRREVFIDFDFRERVYWELRAHISVSTGVWRIPLPGDPLTSAIQPGDEEREFEERSIRDWDAAADPTVGDMRILRGRLTTATVELDCSPISGGGAFFEGGPWRYRRCRGPGEGLCREDFMEVGTGYRHPDRECAREGQEVRFLTWAGRRRDG